MSRGTDGGPAFPLSLETMSDCEGMSLRDWFAGQALAGLCANPGGPFQANSSSGWSIVNCTVDDVAIEAHQLADAMLSRRSKAEDR